MWYCDKANRFARIILGRWFVIGADWANRWLGPICSGAAAISGVLWEKDFATYLVTLVPQFSHQISLLKVSIPLIFVTTFAISVIVTFSGIFIKKPILNIEKELKAERQKISIFAGNIETVVNGLLLKLSERIQFGRGEPSRITIYIHNGNNKFISFGRYSPDPEFSKKGRETLPDNEGCISAAWHTDWCYEGNLGQRPARQRYMITPSIRNTQRMRSVFFAVKRICGQNRVPLAVIVVESQTANRFQEQQIRTHLDNEEAYFAEIIGTLKDHIPDPADAKRRGF